MIRNALTMRINSSAFHVRQVFALILTVAMTACGHRPWGDPGGQLLTFSVVLGSDFAFTRDSLREPSAWTWEDHHRGDSTRSSPSTASIDITPLYVTLKAFDADTRSHLFSQRLVWGANPFIVPVHPHRTIDLFVEVSGRARGGNRIGRISPDTVSPIIILLGRHGPLFHTPESLLDSSWPGAQNP